MLNHTLLFKKQVLEIAYTNKLVKKKQPWPLIIGFLGKYKYNNNNICLSFDRTLLPKEQFFLINLTNYLKTELSQTTSYLNLRHSHKPLSQKYPKTLLEEIDCYALSASFFFFFFMFSRVSNHIRSSIIKWS